MPKQRPKADSFYSKIRLSSLIIIICLLIIFSFTAERVNADDNTLGNVLSVIQKAKNDAEKQIISHHGAEKFQLLKERFNLQYPPDKTPLPKDRGSCDGIIFPNKENARVLHAEIVDHAGAYFTTGIEAVFSGLPDIAKWGFANASSLSPSCSVYLSNLAFVLNEEQNYNDAVELLEYAKTLDPGSSSIYINLAFS
ncbi:MAG: hypothetical protein HY758_10860, partial [Nitrospirae bacterium]|nr:hypothetical protein [Nitrospirota bacterium]